MSEHTWTREPLEHARSCAISVAWMAMAFDVACEFAHSDRLLSDLGECTCHFDRLADAQARIAELEGELESGREWVRRGANADAYLSTIRRRVTEVETERDEARAEVERLRGAMVAAEQKLAIVKHFILFDE